MIELYCAESGEHLASLPAQPAAVNVDRRLIGGVAMPYDVVGTPKGLAEIGATGAIFRAGSLTMPEDATWVKLLIEHDGNQSVGYTHETREAPGALLATYRVADGPAGDQALADVKNGIRDALSVRVEVDRWNVLPGNVLEVLASRVRETSLVSVPAYESARVTLAASLTTTERTALMAELATMLDLSASLPAPGQQAPAQPPEGQQAPPAPPAGQQAPATAPPAQQAPATPPVIVNTPPAAPLDLSAHIAAALAPYLGGQTAAPGAAPAGAQQQAAPATGAGQRAPLTLRAAAEQVSAWFNEGAQDVVSLMAALTDVTPLNDLGGATAANGSGGKVQWLDELWTARQSRRRWIDAIQGTPKQLTSQKAKGWRWVTRPEMGNYAGNKADIPSGPVGTEPVEVKAERTAGGWDVDRAFDDFGDTEFVQSLFEAATESYAVLSDAKFAAHVIGYARAASDPLAALSLVGALGALGAAAAPIGASITWLAVAPDVFAEFSTLTRDQVPWWLGNGDSIDLADGSGKAGGFSYWADPLLSSGEFIGGDRRAVTYYEKGSTPIRAEALNIGKGGIDIGVFGYQADILNDERALFHGEIA